MTELHKRGRLGITFDGDELTTIDQEVARDDVFGALADQQRRYVLHVLSRETSPMDLDTLADQVAELESVDATASSETETSRTRVSLHHHGLPKLESAGLVVYDPDEGTVEADFETLRTTRT